MSMDDGKVVNWSLGSSPMAIAENDALSLSNQSLPITSSCGEVGSYQSYADLI